MRKELLIGAALFAALGIGCGGNKTGEPTANNASAPTNAATEKAKQPETKMSQDGFVTSESGTEKEKPEAGKSNVQGKVLYNEKPAADIDVTLCEKFTTFSGCSGKKYETKTDANGEYLIKNVEPMVYEGLTARVFKSDYYVFAAQKFGLSGAKYKLEADQTFFAPPTNLYKNDLKIQSPKNNASVEATAVEVKWDAYPDAAFYKIDLIADDVKADNSVFGEKVEGTSYKPQKALTSGKYRVRVMAFNANEVRLAQQKDDLTFTVAGGAAASGGTSDNQNANK